MDLKEHKSRLFAYEQLKTEIATLRMALEKQRDWNVWVEASFPETGTYEASFPIPGDYAKKALQEFIWSLESRAKDEARALGIDV